jgi:phosphatidylglycerol---prolipoprotein diacylglyceryl transferase
VLPVLLHIGPLIVPSYGVLSAVGVLVGMAVLLRTSRMFGLNPNQLWNLSIVGLFASLLGSRVLLVAVNWTVVRSHPAWLLSLAMVHHPLLACTGAFFAVVAGILYARRRSLPPWDTADALAPPLVVGFACEQIGALLAGSGYGTETDIPWAVVYTHPLAARWSGAPLFVPVHPVQAYAAISLLAIAGCLLVWIPHRRQPGDISGIGLVAMGTATFLTEFWRDWEGRGAMLGGALDLPQVVAIGLVLGGALVLRERGKARVNGRQAVAPCETGAEVPHA